MSWWYLAGFAFRDLTARTALRATVVVALAVGAAVAFGLIGFGFVYGVERAEYARVGRDPLAVCLWAGDNQYGGQITASDVATVSEKVTEVAPGRSRGVYPIRVVSYQIARADGGDTPATGRTMVLAEDSDPLPASRPVRPGGRWFHGPGDRGAVVTPGLLGRLGYEPAHPPAVLELIYTRFSDPITVPILGVMQDDLPARNHGFIIPESYARELDSPADPNPEGSSARSGEIPDAWITQPEARFDEKLDPTIRAALDREFPAKDGYEYQLRRFGAGYRISAETTSSGAEIRKKLRKKEWMKRFEAIAKANGGVMDTRFLDLEIETDSGPRDANDRQKTAAYSLLAVYTDDVRVIARVAVAIERHVLANGRPLVVDRGVVEQVTRIGEQSGRYEAGMLVVAVTMSTVFAGMVWFVFRVRAEQQVAEIGMLKAMGMGRLGWLAAIQGLMVGVAGVGVGASVGLVGVGMLAARFYPGDPEATAAATYREFWLIGTVAGIALLGCIGCAWEATRRARTLSPAEAIRTAG